MNDCLLCAGAGADELLRRVEVWSDERWRLTVSLESEIPGLAYLEPRLHVPAITDLEGREAEEFGQVIGTCARALRKVTRCESVYVYVVGQDVPHLHVHLAPHTGGDALNESLIRGPLISEELPGGMVRTGNPRFPLLDEAELKTIADQVAAQLSLGASGGI